MDTPLKVYTYAKCDSCRKAVRFLRVAAIAFEEIAIRETPPKKEELRALLAAVAGERHRLFNVSGTDFRSLGLARQLPALTDEEALDLLAANGNLVKRPFVIGNGIRLVGFDETRWREALAT